MKRNYLLLKEKAVELRRRGKTFSEINEILEVEIPKSTLSYWFKDITLSERQKERINRQVVKNITAAQKKSVRLQKIKREKYLADVYKRVQYLSGTLDDADVSKIALTMLYLGEGSKTQRGSVIFGNSDPRIIKLFLRLLRYCYQLDEKKFRCTVQCRADQDIERLEKFWATLTKIPASQFYKANIDPRTVGKITKKEDYKGVCRIDYFSADVYTELLKIIEVLTK